MLNHVVHKYFPRQEHEEVLLLYLSQNIEIKGSISFVVQKTTNTRSVLENHCLIFFLTKNETFHSKKKKRLELREMFSKFICFLKEDNRLFIVFKIK